MQGDPRYRALATALGLTIWLCVLPFPCLLRGAGRTLGTPLHPAHPLQRPSVLRRDCEGWDGRMLVGEGEERAGDGFKSVLKVKCHTVKHPV